MQIIEEKGMSIAHSLVGEYLTVQEMAGFQMFVAKLDDELIEMLEAPSNAPYWVTR
jgi:dihydroxyacetone kinase-like protein